MVGLKIVLDNLDRPINLIVYCLSYGVGNYVGIKLEEYLAIGLMAVNVIIDSNGFDMAEEMRHKGYAVTVTEAKGKDGKKLILSIITKRKNLNWLCEDVLVIAPDAVIVCQELKNLRGGYLNH